VIDAASETGTLGKEAVSVSGTVKTAQGEISKVDASQTKAAKEVMDQITSIQTTATSGLQMVTNMTSSESIVGAACGGKQYLAEYKPMFSMATSIMYVFVFLAIFFGLFGIIFNMLCKPNPDHHHEVAKWGCCFTQCSWMNSLAFIALLSFIGILFFIISLVVGDTCYTLDNIPKVGFENYLGNTMKGMGGGSDGGGGGMNPIAILDTCFSGGDVLPALGIKLPANGTAGSFDTTEIDSMGSDIATLSLGSLDAQKTKMEEAGDADTKKAIDNIDALLAEVKTSVVTIKAGLKSSLTVGLGKVDVALVVTVAKLNDCGFIKDIYTGLTDALCQDGLEGLLWMTLGTLIVVWCGFPMIITSILINIRMSGLGQYGKTRGLDGSGPAGRNNNPSTYVFCVPSTFVGSYG